MLPLTAPQADYKQQLDEALERMQAQEAQLAEQVWGRSAVLGW